MQRDPSGSNPSSSLGPRRDIDAVAERRTQEALHVLLEARDRLLEQMTNDILAHREALLGDADDSGVFNFELQEIEDRYSARLSSLNALLENLEYRQPRVEHRVETVDTTVERVGEAIFEIVDTLPGWDLVDFEVVAKKGDDVSVVAVLARDEYE